jgi:hypothetical protein
MFKQYESPPAALSRTEIFGSIVPFSRGPLGFSLSRNRPVERSIEGSGGEFVVLCEPAGDSGRIFHGSEFAAVSEFRTPASFEGLFRLFCANAEIEQTSEIAIRRRMPVIGASFDTKIIAPPV